ncbi:hypothetical protein Nepgr_014760 [Nepenthes gracilis]|uniref:Uncharacterized protein n=1 Tax=Nepenthes gracilis TaxID=150966 RepID=A0AAD3SLP8_NEPGR|nr:hypothetical protein Nepgr_014760 [Nepenthes gracilis]
MSTESSRHIESCRSNPVEASITGPGVDHIMAIHFDYPSTLLLPSHSSLLESKSAILAPTDYSWAARENSNESATAPSTAPSNTGATQQSQINASLYTEQSINACKQEANAPRQ